MLASREGVACVCARECACAPLRRRRSPPPAYLAEVRGVPEHVHEHELRDVTVAVGVVLFFERASERRRLARDQRSLLRHRAALPHCAYEVVQPRARQVSPTT